MFGVPAGSLTLRGGVAFARAGSDIFDDSFELFTLDKSDFNGFDISADFGVRVAPRFDVVVGVGGSHARSGSEYNDWLGEDNRPIEQVTMFTRVPITAGLRAYLTPRGREIGRFAWVPTRGAVYAQAGAGFMYYRFAQEGEFVNFETLDIVEDRIESSGFTPTVYAALGGEFNLSERFALVADARYSWASAELDPTVFDGFEPIDLSGLGTTVGFLVRF